MAMNGPGLASAIKDAIGQIPEANRNYEAVWDAIGDAIVQYIIDNAEIIIGQDAVAAGVTAGGATVPVQGSCLIS